MSIQVVFVHGIRTSATMWRAQLAHLAERGVAATAVNLPGHGSRIAEAFVIEAAMATIDDAVRDAATRGPVLLVGHSMGGLVSIAYAGAEDPPPVAGFIGASCTAFPRGAGLAAYRFLARRFNALPDKGLWLTTQVLAATLPEETRADFAAGGYAFDAQDVALASLSTLDLAADVHRLRMPVWWINGQFDQLRPQERLFQRLAPHSELIVVPRTSHLVTAMRPRVFNALLDVAVATLEKGVPQPS
ncbi:alpha/beta fold hydrolase [Microbacterium murale]|uniref:Non-heme chloroperoxidase n=1 Tax=Microbacterium murale TaxID=1081040 RepID=A0ABU0PEM6_9MICO|nr:alpha/beta hydrolase [Microbacterium murale]MDQ0645781.1 non-heme chloroperoxidase [Microbacterium murale]